MTPAALAARCAAALPDERLSSGDVEACCFGPGSEVLGNDEAAAVLTVRPDIGRAWRLL